MAKPRTRAVTLPEARARLRVAKAYLDVAELVVAEHSEGEFLNVAAGLSVLAGVAASDAISGRRVGEIHRGDDHRAASELLRGATRDGARLEATFRRLIDMKDAAHYGVMVVSASKAKDAVRWAKLLVERAQEEIDR